jgi:hypothetical protein
MVGIFQKKNLSQSCYDIYPCQVSSSNSTWIHVYKNEKFSYQSLSMGVPKFDLF